MTHHTSLPRSRANSRADAVAWLARQSPAVLGMAVVGAAASTGAAQAGILEINPGFILETSLNEPVVTNGFEFMNGKFQVQLGETSAKIFAGSNFKTVTASVFEDNGFARIFAEGDLVGSIKSVQSQKLDLFVNEDGPFAEVGDTGFIGLRVVQIGDDDFQETFYGFVEVTRGSLELGSIFFEDTANAPALIPLSDDPVDVPEPATLPLMALGAAGLMALRRRRSAA